MDINVINLNNDVVGSTSLDEKIFSLTPDWCLVKRVIDWQLAAMRSGSRKVKNISEVSGTTRKPFKQKGTGNARQGSLRSVQMRGGAISHGPVVRSHATKLPKKIRLLSLKYILSEKLAAGNLFVLDSSDCSTHKTSNFLKCMSNFNLDGNVIFIDECFGDNVVLSTRNLHNILLLPQVALNAYDLTRHQSVFISKEAVHNLETRLNK
ncbi:MAG: 50S ribosomal protein L4 [Rickettsiaceae bacterium]